MEDRITVANETWSVESRHRKPGGKRVRTLPVARHSDGRFVGTHNYRHEGTFGQASPRSPRTGRRR